MTLYQVLDIHRNASQYEIKRAYREKAFKYHPDRNPDNVEKTAELFRQVQEAYETLSNTNTRRIYDSNNMAYTNVKSEPEAGASESENRAYKMARDIIVEFSGQHESTKFESKDAMLAIVLVFAGHLSALKWSVLPPEFFWPLIKIFIPSLFGALILRAVARLAFEKYSSYHQDNFLYFCIYNCVAASWLGFCLSQTDQGPLYEFVITPATPSLLIAIPISLVGASIGRAFSTGGHAIFGIIMGVVTSAALATFAGIWLLFGFIIRDVDMAYQLSLDSKYALLSLFWGSVIASAVGSITMRRVYIYQAFDWIEAWFDRFRPGPETNDMALREE